MIMLREASSYVAKLPEKVEFMCMARVRHVISRLDKNIVIKKKIDNWGCKYLLKIFITL